jgi:hypothetical protein
MDGEWQEPGFSLLEWEAEDKQDGVRRINMVMN